MARVVAALLTAVGMVVGWSASPADAVGTLGAPVIDQPVDGATVSGDLQVSAHSSGAAVRFSTGWTEWTVPVASGVATTTISTLGLDGVGTIMATACAALDDCTGPESSVSVTYDNPAPTITSPAEGAAFWPWETPTLTATSDAPVWFNASNLSTVDVTSPYSVPLDLSPYGGAPDFQVAAQACDRSGEICNGKWQVRTLRVRSIGLDDLHTDVAAFSPDGDGVLDTVSATFTLNTSCDVTYSWVGPTKVFGPVSVGRLGAGEHTLALDGSVAGVRVPDGPKTLRIDATPSVAPDYHHSADVPVMVDTQPPRSVQLAVSRELYPYPDGYADSVTVLVRGADVPSGVTQMDIEILDPDGAVVRSASTAGDDKRLVWRGLDQQGQPLPAGLYTVHATATDQVGHTLSNQATIVVHDQMRVHRLLSYDVHADQAWDWFVGRCSSREDDRRWPGGVRLLSDSRCDSAPYDNDKHVVVAGYRLRLPRALEYGTVHLEVYGGGLSPHAYAGLATWHKHTHHYRLERWLKTPTRWYGGDTSVDVSVDHGRLYWEIFTNHGCRYRLRGTTVSVPVVQLVHPKP